MSNSAARLLKPIGSALAAMMSLAQMAAQAQAPDASPSTPVETIELASFEPTREAAVLEAYVDGIVEAHRRSHGTPGVTVSVVQDGQLIFAKGYGYADIEAGSRVDGRETLFRIGSVSKTFVWAGVMVLHERGVIDLDADVNTYLKDFQIPEAFDAPVTLNDLMAHRAGFEETFGVFMDDGTNNTSRSDALIGDLPKRIHAPGTRTSYSNWGSALAAKIIEDVTGKSFAEFLQEEFLTPLAMTKTTLKGPSHAPAALKEAFSEGYQVKGGVISEQPPMQIGPFAPIGAMGSTAFDMAQWMSVLLGNGRHNGVQLWRADTAAAMFARVFPDRSDANDLARGFFSRKLHGVEAFGHGGGTAAFRTYMEVFPSLNAGVFISQNTTEEAGLVREITDLLIARLGGGRVQAGKLSKISAKDAKAYIGTYLSNRRSHSKFERLFGVAGARQIDFHKDGFLTITSEGGAVAFSPVPSAPDVFENRFGGRIHFARNANGQVDHYSSMYQSYDRAGTLENPMLLRLGIGAAGLSALSIFAGAWRRQGRGIEQTTIGHRLGVFQFVTGASVFGFLGLLAIALGVLSSFTAASFLAYPPSELVNLRLGASLVVILGVIGVASLFPAWRMSGWSVWRKTHHTIFALALAWLSLVLLVWNVAFAPFTNL